MKQIITYCLLFFLAIPSYCQYYLRGEIKDEKNQGLQNAKIFVHSSRTIYASGIHGGFGIPLQHQFDSLTVSLIGYETKTVRVKTDVWQNISLKTTSTVATIKPKLISITKDFKQKSQFNWAFNNETYFQLVENEFVPTNLYPNTGFSLNINKASYSNVRRFINGNSEVPPDAVKVEEMVNYFNLHYREPEKDSLFRIESQVSSCPWDVNSQLLFINVSAKKINLDTIPASNFVFLIDVSGSMDMPNRLPLLKGAFQLFVKNLRPIDKVSIVMYGGTVGIWLAPTSGDQKDKISKSIEELTAAGDTPGESAIRAAYKLAESSFIEGGNNRIILATDGDFNVGESSEKSLDELISKQRQTGVYLTCLGVGMGNFKDSKLQTLAKKGNGNYAYLDDIREAEKVLVKELTQTLYAVANNVYMNVRFNPSMVKEYRLLGFDNKKEVIKDGANELEGGEIGSGNSALAIFQIFLKSAQDTVLQTEEQFKKSIATISINYTEINDSTIQRREMVIPDNYKHIDLIDRDLKFASAITMFALKLKQTKYGNKITWPAIKKFALTAADDTNFLQAEFLMQVYKAQKIYEPTKKKKRKS